MGFDNNTALTSSQVVNIEDLRRMAHRRLHRAIFDYLDTQSGTRLRMVVLIREQAHKAGIAQRTFSDEGNARSTE